MKELNYIVFILGYDLMHDELSNSSDNECDEIYEQCTKIAKEFIKSEEYKDKSCSMYEALENFVEAYREQKENEQILKNIIKDINVASNLFEMFTDNLDDKNCLKEDIKNECFGTIEKGTYLVDAVNIIYQKLGEKVYNI
jgi:predicted transcriptional regulator